ncbi:hypothetical protein Bbelb_041020 [Branchiostoma belcheri]|nr:hypothetical protein Bbelb_041020 [Branchiostoma belcheri]
MTHEDVTISESSRLSQTDKNVPMDHRKNKNHVQWRRLVHQGAELAERRRISLAVSKREARKAREKNPSLQPLPEHKCDVCGRCFRARIGLVSHTRTHKD